MFKLKTEKFLILYAACVLLCFISLLYLTLSEIVIKCQNNYSLYCRFNTGPLGFTWIKHYCTYDKGTKTFTMSIAETKSGGKVVSLHNL